MKRITILLSFVCCALCVWAQDSQQPGFQIADNTFFDPTKKEKKAEPYVFDVEYRIEAGYVQHQQRTASISFPDMYQHGARVGATFTFLLPLNFDVQTGLLYTILYGRHNQHWRSNDIMSNQAEYVRHRVLSHHLTVPVRAYYTIPLWKQLNLFFYTGLQLHIGMAANDYLQLNVSESTQQWMESVGIHTTPYDRMADELVRANVQYGIGGGLEWDRYRLQSGYDFGLNNLVKNPVIKNQKMNEWGWYVSFSYKL